jgi:hypothetical protein
MSPGRVAVVPALVIGVISALLVAAGPAGAADSPEQQLAERFSPLVRLVHQEDECGPGEPYRPTDVDAILGNRDVALRGPWDPDNLIDVGPTAEDLANGLADYHLDLPGNPLRPGCTYERWARAATAGTLTTTYAHVATEAGRPGRLALQYWFYYPFNDYNNKHESDWEMVQLVFAADDAATALDQLPLSVGFSQHEGVEVADWDDPKLDVVDGTHPVVHVASGSHANYYDSALYLGRSGQQGFGCDDTRTPSDLARPVVRTIPQDPEAASAEYPWIDYPGHWGEQREAFYNGPTGPSTKERWTAPITLQDEGRDRSFAVPAGGLFGTTATDFFCSSVAGGSNVVRVLANHPGTLLVAFLVAVLVIAAMIRRTTWRPTAALRVRRRRASGQVLAAAARMYVSRWRLFTSIGLPILPAFLLVTVLQSLILGAPEIGGLSQDGEDGGFRVTLAALISFLALGLTIAAVLAATARALDEVDRGTPVGARRAFRLAVAQWRALLGAFLLSSALVGLCTLTVVLSPLALGLVVGFALGVPVIVLEGAGAVTALRRSAGLVRRQVLKITVLLAASILVATLVGPFLGTLLILTTGAPFAALNVLAGVTFAFLMPYVGLTLAYAYYDAVVTAELAARRPPSVEVLPAES